MKSFDNLKSLVAAAEKEAGNVDKGNKAAGTRLRALMQEVKTAATQVRVDVLAARN